MNKDLWLVLDDSVADQRRFQMALADEADVGIVVASTLTEARELIAHRPFDVLLADYFLKAGITSNKFLQEVRTTHPALPVVVVSGHAGNEVDLYLAGADQVIPKPLSLSDFRNAILNGVRQAKARRAAITLERGSIKQSYLPSDDPLGYESWDELYRLMRTGPLECALQHARAMKIAYALRASLGNKTKAAAELKVERQTLYKPNFKISN